MNRFVALCTLIALADCGSTSTVVTDGQLFCATETTTGPLVVALADAAGVPFTVTGKASSVVAAACAAIHAIPVSPPAVPGQAPVVSAAI